MSSSPSPQIQQPEVQHPESHQPESQQPKAEKTKSLHLVSSTLVKIEDKLCRVSLDTGETVLIKLWDSYKIPRFNCRYEASVYNHLSELCGTVIPKFRGAGSWMFFHVIILSNVDVFVPIFHPTVI
jgi:hypothetical protein